MKVKSRLPIYFLLIATYISTIILLYALGFVIYSKGIASTESFLNDSMRAETTFLIRTFSDSMLKVNKNIQNLISDQNVSRFSWGSEEFMSMYDQFQAVNNIQINMLSIIQQSDFIDDLELFFPKTGNKMGIRSGLDTFELNELATAFDLLRQGEVLNVKENGDMQMFVSNLYLKNPENSNIIISADISHIRLANILEQYIAGKTYDSLLLVYEKSMKVIASTSNIPSAFDLDLLRSEREIVNSESGNFKIKFDQEYQVSYALTSDGSFILYEFRPLQTMTASAYLTFRRWIWAFSIVSSFALIVFALISYKLIRIPTYNMISAFREIEKGEYKISLGQASSREFNQLNEGFNRMVSRLYDLIEIELKQQYLIKEAELKFLQMQINPHFLYNTYFVVSSLIQQEKYDSAEKMTKLLGVYFDYISHSDQLVPLSYECSHARAYGEIQQMRFFRHVTVDFEEIPEGSENIKVPRLIIQPLLENAFEHGIKGMKDAIVSVKFTLSEDYLFIMVEDNNMELMDEDIERITNITRDIDQVENGIALSNISRRMQLYYGSKGGLFVERSLLGGLKITLKIDKRCSDL